MSKIPSNNFLTVALLKLAGQNPGEAGVHPDAQEKAISKEDKSRSHALLKLAGQDPEAE